ncbi:quinone-dependent dihydroorotate dehydrogenase [Methyloligella sp. GL2]|uniref:quinone-dependent dihydroorotate dehydrogenase n=2 Tax=unclassified Methyloligella TaxID=2625955 RepID=UPI00157D3F84|nr:quinone-dependent dihydroorotate dehydrogenase [Methyloligella sp. GL2]
MDPEAAHGLTIRALQLGLHPKQEEPDDPRLAQTVWGLDFPNPIGMAAGFDKNAEVPKALLEIGFGFAEVGTLTPKPQPGNPGKRIFRSELDQAVINRLGFNNEGQAAALERLRSGCSGVVGVNIGANKDSDDRIADYVRGIESLSDVAGYFTVNISSPNTPGLRDLQTPEALAKLLAAINGARRESAKTGRMPPLLVKLAPDIPRHDLGAIVKTCREAGIDGMVISNTTLARDGLRDADFAKEQGGLSGRPLFERATRMLADIYLLTKGELPLIGVGGVHSGETAIAKLEAGASLVQLYTGMVFEGPGLVGEIKQAILDRLEQRGESDLKALIGSGAAEWAEQPPL